MTDEAKPSSLVDMVAYQDMSVVSKTLIQKKTGTVTLFAFDNGKVLREHPAPFAAMTQVLAGEAEIIIAGRPHRVSQGEMIIMPAHEPHALRAVKKFKMMLTMIKS